MEGMSDKQWKETSGHYLFPSIPHLASATFFSGNDATGYEQEASDSPWTNNVYISNS